MDNMCSSLLYEVVSTIDSGFVVIFIGTRIAIIIRLLFLFASPFRIYSVIIAGAAIIIIILSLQNQIVTRCFIWPLFGREREMFAEIFRKLLNYFDGNSREKV